MKGVVVHVAFCVFVCVFFVCLFIVRTVVLKISHDRLMIFIAVYSSIRAMQSVVCVCCVFISFFFL